MPHTYDYPRPALTVDLVVFAFDDTERQAADLKVMLIQRGLAPFKGQWALPGGFLQVDESVADAARRELGRRNRPRRTSTSNSSPPTATLSATRASTWSPSPTSPW